MKQRVAIIGSRGQLGFDLCRTLSTDTSFSLVPLTHEDVDITDGAKTTSLLKTIHPDIIINTAAYHNIDDAETNPKQAMRVNNVAAATLALYCGEHKICCVYISTDYVFGQDAARSRPYTEQSTPGPINVYGQTKLMGEQSVRTLSPKHFVLRTCGLYGIQGASGKKKRNFVDLMIHFAQTKTSPHVVNDQTVSPTYTVHLARQIRKLLHTDAYGLYHASAEDNCTWYECAVYIFRILGVSIPIEPVPTSFFPGVAKRPGYTVLSKRKLRENNIHYLPEWKEGIRAYLTEKHLLHRQ